LRSQFKESYLQRQSYDTHIQPFYSHYTGKPVLASILVGAKLYSFIVHMLLLMSSSAFELCRC